MSARPEEQLSEDTLFLACTRPAMLMGVPLEAAGLNMMLTSIGFIAGRNLLYLLAAPVIHLLFRAICKSDHNAFRLLWLFVETKGRSRNSPLWGGSSATPLPLLRRMTSAEVRRG